MTKADSLECFLYDTKLTNWHVLRAKTVSQPGSYNLAVTGGLRKTVGFLHFLFINGNGDKTSGNKIADKMALLTIVTVMHILHRAAALMRTHYTICPRTDTIYLSKQCKE